MNKAEFLARLHKLLKKRERNRRAPSLLCRLLQRWARKTNTAYLPSGSRSRYKGIFRGLRGEGVIKPKKSMPKALLITLIVLASPLLAGVLGIAIGLAAVAFALAIAAFAVLFSFTIVSLALMLAGIVVVFAAFCVILQSPATCAFFAGLGLVAIGLGVLWAILRSI
ncbi:MAG: hypothetical protein ACLSAP_08630 [Oscillospiraceae bacterium]